MGNNGLPVGAGSISVNKEENKKYYDCGAALEVIHHLPTVIRGAKHPRGGRRGQCGDLIKHSQHGDETSP